MKTLTLIVLCILTISLNALRLKDGHEQSYHRPSHTYPTQEFMDKHEINGRIQQIKSLLAQSKHERDGRDKQIKNILKRIEELVK